MLISNLVKAAWQRIEGALASGNLEADADHRERKQRPLHLMVLEQRVLFSATPLGVDVVPQNQQPGLDPGQSADATLPPVNQTDGYSAQPTQAQDQTVLDSAPAAATTPATPSETAAAFEVDSTGADAQAQQRLELVFVNGDVPDYQRFVEDLAAKSETPTRYESFVLDSSRDGVEQISQTLAAFHDVDTMHLVSSGSNGAIKLGSVWLDSTNLSAYAGDVARWGDALKAGGELLLHDRNLAASAEGRTLLEAMQALAGADISAGTGLTDDSCPLSLWEKAGVRENEAPTGSDAADQRSELIFIDTAIPDYQQLLDGLVSGDSNTAEIVLLDAGKEGFQQIDAALSTRQNVDAIHFISYGSAGALRLGSTWIEASDFNDYQADFTAIGQYLSADADLLFYGCNVASTLDGQAMLRSISEWTGADVSASTDPTGHLSLGGDWALEYQVGPGETAVAVSPAAQQNWLGLLDITTGLKGLWKFDANANDFSGNGYNGTLTNGAAIDATGGTNKVGAGKLLLDGTNDYVSLSTHRSNFTALTQGTISAWIKTTDTSAIILGLNDTADIQSDASLWVSGGKLVFEVYEANSGLLQVQSTVSVNDGAWHHVAATVDAGGNKLYIDGVQAAVTYGTGSAATSCFFANVTGIDTMLIGQGQNSGGAVANFNGLIDDLRMYDQALSATDVAQLATTAPVAANDSYSLNEDSSLVVAPSTANLVNWWKFNDGGTNQTAVDSGSLVNNGTLGSTTGVDAADPAWTTGYVARTGCHSTGRAIMSRRQAPLRRPKAASPFRRGSRPISRPDSIISSGKGIAGAMVTATQGLIVPHRRKWCSVSAPMTRTTRSHFSWVMMCLRTVPTRFTSFPHRISQTRLVGTTQQLPSRIWGAAFSVRHSTSMAFLRVRTRAPNGSLSMGFTVDWETKRSKPVFRRQDR